MHTPPCLTQAPSGHPVAAPQRCRDECIYRAVTLAAMLLLLASLWVF